MKNWSQALTRAIKENDKLKVINTELLGACKEAFVYLDKPYKSKVGNVEIINRLQQAIAKAEEPK